MKKRRTSILFNLLKKSLLNLKLFLILFWSLATSKKFGRLLEWKIFLFLFSKKSIDLQASLSKKKLSTIRLIFWQSFVYLILYLRKTNLCSMNLKLRLLSIFSGNSSNLILTDKTIIKFHKLSNLSKVNNCFYLLPLELGMREIIVVFQTKIMNHLQNKQNMQLKLSSEIQKVPVVHLL